MRKYGLWQIGNPRLGVIKDAIGNTLTESDDILGRWQQYCDNKFKVNVEKEKIKLKHYDQRLSGQQHI